MNYINFEVGNNVYKLRLNTRSIVMLEKQIGCNPLMIFGMDTNNPVVPSISAMVAILHASLQQYEHGISLNDAYDIFDKYLEEHASTDFIPVIMDIYKASGIIANDNKETEVKNA